MGRIRARGYTTQPIVSGLIHVALPPLVLICIKEKAPLVCYEYWFKVSTAMR